MSDFKIKFRGVRGSFPVANRKFLNYGGNTSCVEVNVGNRLIILDAGTGIVSLGDDLMEKYISSAISKKDREPIQANIFISHIHQDHLLGLTFFKPLHINSSKIKIFSIPEVDTPLSKDLDTLIFGKTFPIDLGDIVCRPFVKDLEPNKYIIIKPDNSAVVENNLDNVCNDDVIVSYYKSYVHPQSGVVIYKITYQGKSLVYATDKECYFGGDKNFVKFAQDCDLLIHDAQYTTEDYLNPHSPKQGYGHSTFDMAIEAMKQTNAKTLALFHYDPSYNDKKLDKIKEHYISDNKNIIFSYEDLEIEL